MNEITQTPSAIVLVRPHRFKPNPDTAADNHFQKTVNAADAPYHQDHLCAQAYDDVTRAADVLKKNGVRALMFEDKSLATPDSVYPNNWFSTHMDGTVILYPMYAKNRRLERRDDIINILKSEFNVKRLIDLSSLEKTGIFLEGTGSMVLDHIHKTAYAALSNRTHKAAFIDWCKRMEFTPIWFNAADKKGAPIYHTNVMMGVGTDFAMIGLSLIKDTAQRARVRDHLEAADKRAKKRTIIDLSYGQIKQFAGNIIELMGRNGPILLLSKTAFNGLQAPQIRQLEQHVQLVPVDVTAIEQGGGSIRCMMADIHLCPNRDNIMEAN